MFERNRRKCLTWLGSILKWVVATLAGNLKALRSTPTLALQIGLFSIALTTFLKGIEYFERQPSVKIERGFVENVVGSNIHGTELYAYFLTTGMPIPDALNMVKQYKAEYETINLERYTDPESGQTIFFPMLGGGIERLERKLMSPVVGQSARREWIQGTLAFLDFEKAKQDLSKDDYLILLRAALYARVVSNDLIITNDGQLELTDLRVSIPIPSNDLEQDHISDVPKVGTMCKIPYTFNVHENNINLAIPRLKIGEKFRIRIGTRTYPIDERMAVMNYSAMNRLNRRSVILTSIVSFLGLMIVTSLVCKLRT